MQVCVTHSSFAAEQLQQQHEAGFASSFKLSCSSILYEIDYICQEKKKSPYKSGFLPAPPTIKRNTSYS